MWIEILQTGALATLPLVEQRLAIPVGYFSFELPIGVAIFTGTFFNAVSVAIVLWLWPIIAKFCAKRSPFFDRILQKVFARTRKKHSKKMEIWGDIFLIFFVALPIPGSGGWSGSLVAWLFGVPYRRAVWLITGGLVIGGLIVGGLTAGIGGVINFFNEAVSDVIL